MNLEFSKKMNDLFGTLSFFSHQSSLGVSVIKNTNLLGGPILGGQVILMIRWSFKSLVVKTQLKHGVPKTVLDSNFVKNYCTKDSL